MLRVFIYVCGFSHLAASTTALKVNALLIYKYINIHTFNIEYSLSTARFRGYNNTYFATIQKWLEIHTCRNLQLACDSASWALSTAEVILISCQFIKWSYTTRFLQFSIRLGRWSYLASNIISLYNENDIMHINEYCIAYRFV